MINCNINGFDNSTSCVNFAVAGIKKVWLAVFGDLYDYTYTDNDLGIVTGLKAHNLPVEYVIEEGSFEERYLYQGSVRYTHKLTLTFAKMSKEKRNELEKVVGNKLTVIFQDYNGKCWIAGQDYQLRTTDFSATTGGEFNGYTLVLEGRAMNQVREITCIDDVCFAAFNGTELRQSQFVIENASIFDFSGVWEMIADTSLLSYNSAQPLDPVNWSNPAILSQDLIELTNFVGNPNTSISLNYNAGLDIAYITFLSTDTTYDFLTFNAGVQNRSNITITLNLTFTLTSTLLSSATISVEDGTSTVIYSGSVGDSIGSLPASIYGTVDNAFIVVSDLYPNGTTFTATVSAPSCETKEYTYVSEPLANCTFDSTVGYYFGRDYNLEIQKSDLFEDFRFLIIRFENEHFPIIKGNGDQTNDFTTVQTLIVNALSQSLLIDTSSIQVSDLGTSIRIYFKSLSSVGTCTAVYLTSVNTYIHLTALQSSLINVETQSPTSSIITISDSGAGVMAGVYGSTPSTVTLMYPEDIAGVSNQQIENIGFLYTGYPEDEAFTVSIKSNECPTTSYELDSAVCYDATNLSINKRYELWKLDMSGEISFNIGTNFGIVYEDPILGVLAIPFSISSGLGGYENSQEWVEAFHSNLLPLANGDLPIRILKFTFDYANWVYFLELEVDEDVAVSDIEVDDLATAFNFVSSTDITFVEAAVPTMNPYTNFAWSFNDYYTNAQVLSDAGEEAITNVEVVPQNSYTFLFNSGSGEVEFGVTAPNPTSVDFEFYDAAFNYIGAINVVGASYSDTPVGDPNDYAYIVVKNGLGLWSAITYDHSTQQDTLLNFVTYNDYLNFWGRFDRWWALTPAVFVPSPVVTSTLCP